MQSRKAVKLRPQQKNPLILYCWRPHAQLVHNEWLSRAPLWDYYMAQQGYIDATVDNRGSAIAF